ncbi:hypothetical protein J6590_025160 [Homalodisca vitripennis]|nr:hypothetical protein J6590_025160 [Homalodisca vitripennis]
MWHYQGQELFERFGNHLYSENIVIAMFQRKVERSLVANYILAVMTTKTPDISTVKTHLIHNLIASRHAVLHRNSEPLHIAVTTMNDDLYKFWNVPSVKPAIPNPYLNSLLCDYRLKRYKKRPIQCPRHNFQRLTEQKLRKGRERGKASEYKKSIQRTVKRSNLLSNLSVQSCN